MIIDELCECGERATEQIGDRYFCDDCSHDYESCYHCSDVVQVNDLHEYEADYYCDDCFYDLFRVCCYCDDTTHRDFATIDNNGDVWCDNCYSGNHSRCECCGNLFHVDDIQWFGDTPYCGDCFENNFYSCSRCGELVRDGYNCDCSPLKCYSYKPSPEFKSLPSEKLPPAYSFTAYNTSYLYAGSEIEMEANEISPDGGAEIIAEYGENHFYCKTDSSLHNGLEMVSHPMTREYYYSIRGMITEIFNVLKAEGFRSYNTSTAGIHVHLSKSAFLSTEHLFRFTKWFYDNLSLVHVISQRHNNNTGGDCSWHYTKEISVADLHIWNWINGVVRPPRYTAVNLQNPQTVEIRIFKGTLHAPSFFKNIDFCSALFEYSKQEYVGAFTEWVTRKEYPYLNHFLKGRI